MSVRIARSSTFRLAVTLATVFSTGVAVTVTGVVKDGPLAAATVALTDSCGYSGTGTSGINTAFNESTVTRTVQVFGSGTGARIAAFANDEGSLLLGMNGATGFAPADTTTLTTLRNHLLSYTSIDVAGLPLAVASNDKIAVTPLGGATQTLTATAAAVAGATTITVQSFHPTVDWAAATTTVTDLTKSPPYGHVTSPINLGSPAPDAYGRPQAPTLFLTRVYPTRLTTALASGVTASSLSVVALTQAIPAGDPVVISTTGKSVAVVASAPAAIGDTTIAVNPFTASMTYPVGSTVVDAGGDWQAGHNPGTDFVSDVFGTWVTATNTGGVYTATKLLLKNNWKLGPGADTPVGGFGALGTDEGYGTEVRWNVSNLKDSNGDAVAGGATYRVQVLTHDGDQNKTGGDAGEACTTLTIPAPRILLTPHNAVNPVGTTHTFTATLQMSNSTGTWDSSLVPDGTTISFSFVGDHSAADFFPSGTSTCTTTSGACTITIKGTAAGTVTVHATATFTPTGASDPMTVSTQSGAPNDDDAVKVFMGTQLAAENTLVGLPSTAGGTVSYTAYPSLDCTGTGVDETPTGPGANAVVAGVAPASKTVTIGTGTAWGPEVSFKGHYSGDGTIPAFDSGCVPYAEAN